MPQAMGSAIAVPGSAPELTKNGKLFLTLRGDASTRCRGPGLFAGALCYCRADADPLRRHDSAGHLHLRVFGWRSSS